MMGEEKGPPEFPFALNTMKTPVHDATRFFIRRLKERLPDAVRYVFLFGSQARGDPHPGSDYDFAVIVHKKDAATVQTIREIEVEFLDRFDTLASALIYDTREWERRRHMPIGMNIAREGILL
jgi:predicted nucleotidyltransferase